GAHSEALVPARSWQDAERTDDGSARTEDHLVDGAGLAFACKVSEHDVVVTIAVDVGDPVTTPRTPVPASHVELRPELERLRAIGICQRDVRHQLATAVAIALLAVGTERQPDQIVSAVAVDVGHQRLIVRAPVGGVDLLAGRDEAAGTVAEER